MPVHKDLQDMFSSRAPPKMKSPSKGILKSPRGRSLTRKPSLTRRPSPHPKPCNKIRPASPDRYSHLAAEGSGEHIYARLQNCNKAFYEHEREESYGRKWRASFDEAFNETTSVISANDGWCSLSWFLYKLLRYMIAETYGEKEWQRVREKHDIKKPRYQGTKPVFVFADWENGSKPAGCRTIGAFLDYSREILDGEAQSESSSEVESSSESDAGFKSESDADFESESPAHSSSGCDSEPESESESVEIFVNVTCYAKDTLNTYLKRAFEVHTAHHNLGNLALAGGSPWTIIMRGSVDEDHMGDWSVIEHLLEGVKWVLGKNTDNMRIVTLAPPQLSWTNHAWENGTIRAVWFRRMWRAWALIWCWADMIRLDKRARSEWVELDDFLISVSGPGMEMPTTESLMVDLKKVNRKRTPSRSRSQSR